MAGIGKVDGERPPAAFNLTPCLFEFLFSNFGANDFFAHLGRNGLSLRADVGGIAPQARAIDSIVLGLFVFAANCPFCGVRLNAEQPQVPSELGSPVPESRFLDVESHPRSLTAFKTRWTCGCASSVCRTKAYRC